jgi:hypothetical protein
VNENFVLQYEVRRDDVGGRRGGVHAGRARRRAEGARRAPGATSGALQRPQQPPVAAAAGLSSRTSKITNFHHITFFWALSKI